MAIETTNLFSQKEGLFVHKEDKKEELDFIVPMIENNCFNSSGFAYFNNKIGYFFISYNSDIIAIMKLRKDTSVNKVLLQLKCTDFIAKIS